MSAQPDITLHLVISVLTQSRVQVSIPPNSQLLQKRPQNVVNLLPALFLVDEGDQQQGQQQLCQPAVEDGPQQAAEVQAQVGLLLGHLHDGQQPGAVSGAQGPPQKCIGGQIHPLTQPHLHLCLTSGARVEACWLLLQSWGIVLITNVDTLP